MKYGLNSLFCTQNVKSLIGSKNSVIWTYRWITAAAAKLFLSCPTLCDPIDGSPEAPLFILAGILQARILEWVAIYFSKVNSMYS